MSSARTEVVKMSLVDNWLSSFEKISAIAITDFMSGSFECPSVKVHNLSSSELFYVLTDLPRKI
jgi:hypothetical protein